MRLLYLYVNDNGYFSPYEVSFDGQYQFSYKSANSVLDLSLHDQGLPKDFFHCAQVRNSETDDVSIIVGKNGAGKTSIARFLKAIRENPANTKLDFDYILVYETYTAKTPVWHIQSFVRYSEDSRRGSKQVAFNSDSLPRNVRLVDNNAIGRSSVQDFELIYYTPHLTIENPFGNGSNSFFNLSPNYYLSGEHENENMLAKFESVERRRALDFIRYVRFANGAGGDLDFTLPRRVKIELNQIIYSELLQWLNSEIRRLRENQRALNSQKLRFAGKISAEPHAKQYKEIDALLNIARNVRIACRKANSRLLGRNKDFLISCFVIYTLSVLKDSKYFTFNNFNPDASYGRRLIVILEECMERFAEARVDISRIHDYIIEGLSSAVQDSLAPGTLVSSPMQVERRERAVKCFIMLSNWCRHQKRDVDKVECLDFESDSEELYRFIDDYGWSIHSFDYLYITFIPVLAAGDMSYLTMYARITGCIEALDYARSVRDSRFDKDEQDRINRENPSTSTLTREVLLFLDEAETTLHPTKQANLLYNILRFCQYIYKGYHFHIIFATHSPVLLSDIPKSHAVLLSKNEEKNRIEVNQDRIENTFGANIFDLYRLPFFMEQGTTGRFAQQKIDALIEKVRAIILSQVEGNKELSVVRYFTDDDKRLIRLIGEERIRKYFDYWVEKSVEGR